VGEVLFDAIEVEIVADVLFIDFAEELMVFQGTEPIYPANAFL
jgi:hypothetical protein